MKIKAAVIGQPIGHSLSPVLFHFLAEKHNVDLDYKAIEVSSEDLQDKLGEFKKDYIGLNVTLPHKENVVKFADQSSLEVKVVGAANVIHFRSHQCFLHNTDVQGLKSAWALNSMDLKDKNILIIGGGGAARAVACAAAQVGVKSVWIYNRNFKRSELLLRQMTPAFPKTSFNIAKITTPVDLVVNATPLGMSGFEDGQEYFEKAFDQFKIKPQWAFDLIYKPEITSFMDIAKKHGAQAIGGIDMFIYQALATWNLWFGETTFSDDIKETLKMLLKRSMNA